jgi:V/A-type H+-transporting ATPase subunit B
MISYSRILEIVGDIIKVHVPVDHSGTARVRFRDLAVIEDRDANRVHGLAQVIELERDHVSLQVFSGTKGLSTRASVRFFGHPMRVTYASHILGRIFNGVGNPIDGGPSLDHDPKIEIGGPSVNPARRMLASRLIRTGVPMIDVFNTLVESQKIPIFSVAGEPYNKLLARIGIQADADIVIFGGMGLIFDDYHFFRKTFEDAGVFSRTIMFTHLASDPTVETILIPDMALAVAERFAIDEGKRVLVLLTDMTAFADALKEIGISMEHVPSNRGYMGDLYSQLARRYEKASFFRGAGSVTVLTVTTMPGGDVTHPVPDNTGYITEGQFYLKDGAIDPFGSLSRLKQHVIGKVTREDHAQVMNAMIRFFSGAREAEQKHAMSFELSGFDHKLLKFGKLFRKHLMDIDVSLELENALDLCWQMMADCFDAEELLIKQNLVDKYLPRAAVTEGEEV